MMESYRAVLDKGIVIIVTGHANYGRMAFNLAATIKAVEDFPIAVMFNGHALAHIGEHQKKVFDLIIPIDESIPHNPSCKLYAPQYSPFKKTIIFDADMLWLPQRKPSELFEELKDYDFTAITEGKESEPGSYYFWCDPGEVKQHYNLKTEMHKWRSEVVYFNENGASVLNRALEIVKKPGISSVTHFAHSVPDELGINIATSEMGILPHKYKWQPSFWHLMNGNFIYDLQKLYREYYLISFGANRSTQHIKQIYTMLVGAACYKVGLQNVFSLIDKRVFLPTVRDKM